MNKRLKLMMPDGVDGNTGTQTQQTQQTQQTTENASFDFSGSIKDAETKEAFGKMFPGMKSVEDLAKTAVHQQRKIGQQGVPLPTKPEETVTWLQTHLKAPKDEKGYNFDKLNIPQGLPVDKVALQDFAKNFAKHGILPEQANGVLEAYYGYAQQEMAKGVTKRAEEATASTNALKKEWGTDFDANMKSAEMALGNLGNDDLKKVITESGLHNNLQFVKFLHSASKLMKEDTISGKMSGGGFAAGPQQAQAEIDTLYAKPEFRAAYFNANHPGHKQAQDQMRMLSEIKHGERGRKTV